MNIKDVLKNGMVKSHLELVCQLARNHSLQIQQKLPLRTRGTPFASIIGNGVILCA